MINCGILTTGYSHDPIMFGIIDRATTSLPLWLQMQGRCSLIYPNKKYFTILDFGDNHTRLGLWNQKREWSLLEKKKNKKAQPMAVKTCPSCGAMLPARVMLCEFCQHVFEKPETELKDGVMVLYESNVPVSAKGKRISELSVAQLIECQTTKKISSHGVWRIIRSRGEYDLSEYAKAKGYSNGWLWRQKQEMQNRAKVGFKDKVL